jgi:hypothetical protein
MATSPFAQNRGFSQQRVASATAADGSYVFELGDAGFGDARIGVGDYHQVSQTVEIPAQIFLFRPVVKVVLREELPAGRQWQLKAFLNGVEVYSRVFTYEPPFTLNLVDIAIPLNEANFSPATDIIAFRLELA